MIKFIKAGIYIVLALLLNACYYDNEEELYPVAAGNCDTTNSTYTGTVAIIIEERCNSCHGSNAPSGGVITDNYNKLKDIIEDNDRFWRSINHENDVSPMPQGGKLSDCDLQKIRTWLDNGYPNI